MIGANISLMAAAAMVATTAENEERPAVDPDQPPRRLSIEKTSPFYDPCFRRIGVKFDGIERQKDVVEYDQDAGWIRVHQSVNGKALVNDRGEFVTETLHGTVEPYFKDQGFRTIASREVV